MILFDLVPEQPTILLTIIMEKTVKYTDDYEAKIRIWARESKVYPLPPVKKLPRIRSRKFNSYEEFNRWKTDLLKKCAASEETEWTK